ncbi:MAG: ABC transporter ATP-binding protein [Chloroflexota bacterium]
MSFSPGSFRTPHVHGHHYKDTEGRGFDWNLTRELLQFLEPHKKKLALGATLMLVSSGLALLTPYLIKRAIDNYIANQDLMGLTWMALFILAAYGTDFLVTWRQRYVLSEVGNDVLRDMRGRLFRHYQVLSMSYLDQHDTGSLIARMLSDVGVVNQLLSQGIISLLSDVVILVSIVTVMIIINARLALLTFTVLPVMGIAAWQFGKRARVAYRKTRAKNSELTGRLAEDLDAMRVIQAFSEEDRTSEEFDEVNQENRDAQIKATMLSSFFTPIMELLSVSATAIILWFGGRAVMDGTMTLGVIVAFLTYTSRLFQPILDLSMIFNTWQAAMAGGERIIGILKQEPEIQDPPEPRTLSSPKGHVAFEEVDFEYVSGVPVLKDVSFEIEPGRTVALVGPTGAGKTTIAQLLMRFYDVSSGSIRIDGIDIRDLEISSLREQLGVVPQEPFLFQGSLAYNIAFGNLDADRQEIIEAAKAANAHDFISRLPQGYDTKILEGSTNLSLGQRQLVCLARVILASPNILVLDEATSSVDLHTESLIQDALQQLMAGRTSLVIAHRLATVQRADTLLVIDEGRIVERGTHEELLSHDGVYAELYRTQFLSTEAIPA